MNDPSNWEEFTNWIGTSGVKIGLIALGTYLLIKISESVVTQVVKGMMSPDKYASEREEHLREQTVISLVSALTRIALIGIAAMVVLTELGIQIGPLLATAGVAGFALGFGAQSLIEDFIAGIFIVMENQYRVGDVIKINNGTSGKVKKISARITVLRDLDGNVHYIPNGSIDMATNMTMEYASINMNIGVAYDSDIDKVKKVINDVGLKLTEDEEWSSFITEAPYFARVNEFGDSAIEIKIFGKTLPAKQWVIEGELRKRLKAAFDKNHIVIPFPQRVIHQVNK